MKLITWNVNGASSSRARRQVEALKARSPGVVALQEVSAASVSTYEEALRGIGLPEIVHTLGDASGTQVTGVLVASRFLLTTYVLPNIADVVPMGVRTLDRDEIETHWRRRALMLTVASPTVEFDLFNVYITPGSHHVRGTDGKQGPYLKIDLLSAVYYSLAQVGTESQLRVLCGDFNCPKEEGITGEIIYWGKEDQQHIERKIHEGLREYKLTDVYRWLHGYVNAGLDEAISYLKPPRRHRGERRRYDHVFASLSLVPRTARYLTELRGLGLSDHIPLEVVLQQGIAVAGHQSGSRDQE